MPAYAHTLKLPNGNAAPEEAWEPLFTPFGEDLTTQCQREHCKSCRTLQPNHGHLNKVAYWCADFAAAMFPPGPNREAAH